MTSQPSPASLPGHFGIVLNFYNRDADASKVEIVTFDCKEVQEIAESGEERKAGEPRTQNRVATGQNLTTQFLELSLAQQKGMKPMEFSVFYLIER